MAEEDDSVIDPIIPDYEDDIDNDNDDDDKQFYCSDDNKAMTTKTIQRKMLMHTLPTNIFPSIITLKCMLMLVMITMMMMIMIKIK